MYEIKINNEFNSIEIAFDSKPSEAVRDALKALRFRWHGVKKVWYGYATEDEAKTAIDNATNGIKTAKAPKKAEKINKFGVEVGDVFYMSWGYEQTNVDFYQVVELIGQQSVRIVHVHPDVIKSENEGAMCGTYTYNLTKEPMAKDYGVHLKDKEYGDIKRVLKSGDTLYLNMASYANAYKVPHGEYKAYVSWYA